MEIALTNPKITIMNAKEMIETRFVEKLDDGGFIEGLYKN